MEIESAYKNEIAEIGAATLEGIRSIAERFSAQAIGEGGVLYTGDISPTVRSRNLALQMWEASGQTLNIIDKTPRGIFLMDDRVTQAISNRVYDILIADGKTPQYALDISNSFINGPGREKSIELVTRSAVEQLADLKNSLWGRASETFASSLRGDIQVVGDLSLALSTRAFGQIEIPTILSGQGATSLGGHAIKALRAAPEQAFSHVFDGFARARQAGLFIENNVVQFSAEALAALGIEAAGAKTAAQFAAEGALRVGIAETANAALAATIVRTLGVAATGLVANALFFFLESVNPANAGEDVITERIKNYWKSEIPGANAQDWGDVEENPDGSKTFRLRLRELNDSADDLTFTIDMDPSDGAIVISMEDTAKSGVDFSIEATFETQTNEFQSFEIAGTGAVADIVGADILVKEDSITTIRGDFNTLYSADGAIVHITGNNNDINVNGDDGHLIINGTGNEATIHGDDARVDSTQGGNSLTVDGDRNTVNAATGDVVGLIGTGEYVAMSGGTVYLVDGSTSVTLVGDANVVNSAYAGNVVGLLGANNNVEISNGTVYLDSAQTSATIYGNGVTVNSAYSGNVVGFVGSGEVAQLNHATIYLGDSATSVTVVGDSNIINSAYSGNVVGLVGLGSDVQISNGTVYLGDGNATAAVHGDGNVVNSAYAGNSVEFYGTNNTADFSNGTAYLQTDWSSLSVIGNYVAAIANGDGDSLAVYGYGDVASLYGGGDVVYAYGQNESLNLYDIGQTANIYGEDSGAWMYGDNNSANIYGHDDFAVAQGDYESVNDYGYGDYVYSGGSSNTINEYGNYNLIYNNVEYNNTYNYGNENDNYVSGDYNNTYDNGYATDNIVYGDYNVTQNYGIYEDTYNYGDYDVGYYWDLTDYVYNYGYYDCAYEDPLVLNLAGGTVTTTSLSDSGVRFDMQADGNSVKVGWITADEGLLVYDSDHSGIVNNGSKLVAGFEALNELAAADGASADGLLNAEDAIWDKLKVWIDVGCDGIFAPSELHSLEELGISGINLSSVSQNIASNGNTILGIGSFLTADGGVGAMAAVGLQVENLLTPQTTPLATGITAGMTAGEFLNTMMSSHPVLAQ